jgi:hypothetical protein
MPIQFASEETHDPERQSFLRSAAVSIASDMARNPNVLAVLLTGSVARTPVLRSSDLDLHLLLTAPTHILPEWSFSRALVVNAHHVSAAELARAFSSVSDPARLATLLYRTLLADELDGFQPLYERPGYAGLAHVEAIVAARRNTRVVAHIAELFFRDYHRFLDRAERALCADAIADAHQALRWGIQRLLLGALVLRSWMIRGSTHQIEIAMAFLPDPELGRIIETVLEVVDLATLNSSEAEHIAGLRVDLRENVLDVLRKWQVANASVVNPTVEFQLRHNSGGFNYYAPLLKTGMHRGAINHIRTISGFSRIPSWLLPISNDHDEWPISKFLVSKNIDDALKTRWALIAGLDTSAPRVRALLRKMRYSLNPRLSWIREGTAIRRAT